MELLKSTNYIVVGANVFLFLIIFTILVILFTDKPKITVTRKKKKSFNLKSIFFMILASAGTTMIISSVTFSKTSSVLIFLCILLITPSILDQEALRIKNEDIFDDVIVYCHNTAMLLKNTHNVFESIDSVRKDLKTNLSDDVKALLLALQDSREETKEVMSKMDKNFDYSCIKQLNIIIMFMFYENSKIDERLLDNYQHELEMLQKSVETDKAKRKTLRLQYIFISISSIICYAFFLKNMGADLAIYENNRTFRIVNTLYVFCVMTCLYFANRYFTANGVKE